MFICNSSACEVMAQFAPLAYICRVEANMTTLTVDLPDALSDRLLAASTSAGQSPQHIIVEAVAHYLDGHDVDADKRQALIDALTPALAEVQAGEFAEYSLEAALRKVRAAR
jgi:predicted transcriptional regulator